jgi:peptidoglycan/xylan/chitin deacetylase (PgdA/CDA1 family)
MKTIILCYHKVGEEQDEGRWLNCSPSILKEHVTFFARKNFPCFLPRDFKDGRPAGVCFTFDDAYVSAIQNAPHILESMGFRGAFYAVPSLVGKSSEWDQEKSRPLATWAELLRVQSAGHEIGNHTFSHAKMNQLSFEDQQNEWQQANDMLRNQGIHPQSGCFPYGFFNEGTLESLASTGIKVGLALKKRPVKDDLSICLPRVIVSFSDRIPKLLYKIHIRPILKK